MNRKIFLLHLVIFIASSSFSQSPFIKSNAVSSTALPTIDSVKITFSEKVDKISELVHKLEDINRSDLSRTIPSIITMDSLSKEYVKTKYDDSIYTTIRKKMEDDLVVVKRKLKESRKTNGEQSVIADLKSQIDELEGRIKIISEKNSDDQKKIADLENDIKDKQKSIGSAIFSNFQLQGQILQYQYSKSEDALNSIISGVDKLNSDVQALDKAVKDMNWVQEKLLVGEDNKADKQYYVKMGKFIDKAEQAATEMTKPIEGLKSDLASLKEKKDQIGVILGLGQNEQLYKNLDILFKSVDSINKIIDGKIKQLKEGVNKNGLVLKDAETVITTSRDEIIKVYKKYESSTGKQENNLQAIAGITQPLGRQGQLVPNISILGYKSVSNENSSMSSQLKLFVGANSQDQNTFNSNYKLFIPEMSTFGFTADFSLGFIPSTKSYVINKDLNQPIKKLGINLSSYYLGKSLNKLKDSTSFNVGVLQFKTGFQYILIGKVLSVYGNVNSFFIANGIDDFKENFNYDKKLRGFIDFGLECYLDLITNSKDGGLSIDLDLGFISAGGDVKSLVPGSDPLIPRIKLSIVKGLNF